MPWPSASAAASSAKSPAPFVFRHGKTGRPRGGLRLWIKPVDNPVGARRLAGRMPARDPCRQQDFSRYSHSVEIPLMRDAPLSVENGECDGSYQPLIFPTTAARTTIVASCLRTGVSSGRELTANSRLYPFWVRFQ